MADSDNSITLPFVTRRTMLTGTAIAIGTLGSSAFTGASTKSETSSDPVVALWHQWQDAHLLMQAHARKLEYLERQLEDAADFPCATIQLSDGECVTAYSRSAIRELLNNTPDESEARATAEAEFAARQLRWDEADREIGYSATVAAEHEAGNRALALLNVMAATASTSLAGVEAKLDAMLHEGSAWDDCTEFPWPQIRSVFNDVMSMARHCANGDRA